MYKFLKILNFKLKSGTENFYVKEYFGYEISVEFNEADPEKSIIDYGTKINVHRKTTSSFNNSENLVVFECINRLLEKGYAPESLELEKQWKLGIKDKGFLDILVKDKAGNSLFMIECKTGDEFDKEKNKMLKNGGQLFSYYRQDKKAKALCLYTSKCEDDKISYTSEIIDTKNLVGDNDTEIFDSWINKDFEKGGIFENDVKCYEFKNVALRYEKLKKLTKADGGKIFHRFATILRRHNISDKSNAFNKIFNLFLCKIYDEDMHSKTNKELDFQYKKDEKFESFIERLNILYRDSLNTYIKMKIVLMTMDDLNQDLSDEKKNEILYYNNPQHFAFKEYHDKESFYANAEVVKEVVELLEKFQIKYEQKQQYLGDFFELLLNTGFKQESGQFFTPIPLTRFICKSLPIEKIIKEKLKTEIDFLPHVIDYASGSGHFITEIMDEIDFYVRQIEEKNIEKGEVSIKRFNSKKNYLQWAQDYVYAIEKDYRLVKISKVSSFLHGDGDAHVISCDGLAPFCSDKYEELLRAEKGKKENKQFDIIVSNPPYSVDGFARDIDKEYSKYKLHPVDYFELYQYLTEQSSEIECLFIERTKQILKDGGVAGIILPISILTNGGIYEKAREMILDNFNIKAIVSLGSNAFMATGTKTIILFLEKRNLKEFNTTKEVVEQFLCDYRDVICSDTKNAFSNYIKNVHEDLEFEDYVSILQGKPTEKAKESELAKEYKDFSNKEIIELERQKLIYFMTTYSQKIVLADSGEKDVEKEFYGYDFSNRRGHEGIQIDKDEDGNLNSKLYNPDFEEIEDSNKLNSYILRNYKKDEKIEREIEEIKAAENHPLKEHIYYLPISQLMSFELKKFDKSINLNKRNELKIETMWKISSLSEIFSDEDIESGNREKGGSKREGVMSLGGEHIGMNGELILENMKYVSEEYFNTAKKGIIKNNDILICKDGALTGKVAIVGDGFIQEKAMINEHLFKIPEKSNVINQFYLFSYLFLSEGQRQIKYGITGKAQGGLNRENLFKIKFPLPPFEIQEKIVKEIGEIEKKETEAREKIDENEEKIKGLFSQQNDKLLTISEIAQSLTAGGDVPKEAFSNKKTDKYQIPIYSNSCQNKGLYGYTNIVKINESCVTISARGTIGYTEARNEPFYPIVRLIVLIPKKEIANVLYLKYLLNRVDFIESGTTTPQLTIPQISGVRLSIPPLSTQQKIIAQIEPLEREIDEAKAFLAKAKNMKQDILDKYLK